MAISLRCGCGKSYRFKNELAGKRTKCKECGCKITIPEIEVAAEEESQDGLSPEGAWEMARFLASTGNPQAAEVAKCDICRGASDYPTMVSIMGVEGNKHLKGSGWLIISHAKFCSNPELIDHAMSETGRKTLMARLMPARARENFLKEMNAQFGGGAWLLCPECVEFLNTGSR